MINGSGASGEPKGILNLDGIGSVVGGENGAVLDWKKVVGLETAVAVENADLGIPDQFESSWSDEDY